MFDDPLDSNPPPKPPCSHEYDYSIYFEKLKDSYVVERVCSECGERQQEAVSLKKGDDPDEMSEEEIKDYFR